MVAALGAAVAWADEVTVPAQLQAGLLARAANYDRNFARRSGDSAKILVVTSASPASAQFFGQLRQTLANEQAVGNLPHSEEEVPFSSAAALAAKVKAEHVAIVFVAPGLADADVKALVAALSGLDVLTAGANPAWIPLGLILGFDLVSGRPRLLVNLKQSQRQSVAFGADFLRLAQVIDP